MAKREFGAVRRLPSGRWQAKYRHPGANRFIAAPTTFAIKTDATRWLLAVQREIEGGRWIDPSWGEVTLQSYATSWLAQRTLRPRTVEFYEGILRLYIIPDLGSYELSTIVPGGQVVAFEPHASRTPGPVHGRQGLPTTPNDLRNRSSRRDDLSQPLQRAGSFGRAFARATGPDSRRDRCHRQHNRSSLLGAGAIGGLVQPSTWRGAGSYPTRCGS